MKRVSSVPQVIAYKLPMFAIHGVSVIYDAQEKKDRPIEEPVRVRCQRA